MFEFLTTEIWAYTIGTIGYAIFVTASYFKCRNTYLILDIVSALLVGVQWIMLDHIVPGAMNLAFAYASICGYLLVRHDWARYIYMLVFPACIAIYLWQGQSGWMDSVALVFTLISLSSRYFINMTILRSMQIGTSLAWIAINISGGAYFGALCNIGFLIGHVKNLAEDFFEKRKREALPEGQPSLV